MKTLICVPCMDQVPALFAQSLAMLQKVDDTAVTFRIGSLIYMSRNMLAAKSIQMEADYVLWLDSDMTFMPDTLQRMHAQMAENNLDILSGLYFRRVPPYSPVLYDKIECTGEDKGYSEFKDIPPALFEAGGIGFGCVLMKTDVFLDVQSKFGAMFDPIEGFGEDLSFCWRARQCGYKIMVDPTISLGHVGTQVVNKDLYVNFKRASEAKGGGEHGAAGQG